MIRRKTVNRYTHLDNSRLGQLYEQAVYANTKLAVAEAEQFNKREQARLTILNWGQSSNVLSVAALRFLLLWANRCLWRFKRRTIRWRQFVGRHPVPVGAIITIAALLFIYNALLAIILPQTLDDNFTATQNCTTSPVILPGLFSTADDSAFRIVRPAVVSLGHVGLFSTKLCVTAHHTPASNTVYRNVQVFKLPGITIHKPVVVYTKAYPALILTTPAGRMQALPLLRPVTFKIADKDAVFTYALSANGRTAVCNKQYVRLVSCNLRPLGLSYGTAYHLQLVREFNGHVAGAAYTGNITTITAVGIARTSIAADATVYDKPTQLILVMTKPLRGLFDASLSYTASGKQTVVPTKVTYKGDVITALFSTTLPRQVSFDFHIAQVTAIDGSQLEAPYDLTFTTSGGPKVTGVNIGSYGIGSQPTIVVSFDQILEPGQSLPNLISLTANGSPQALSYNLAGNQITIRPTTPMSVCAKLNITTTNAISSQYQISGNSAWSFASRVNCYTTFSIGTSVQGRPITGYRFGSGSSLILYIGAMHGDERNSMVVLQKWVNALNADADRIPAGRTIEVIPAINPDGVAADTRVNAHGIDLNRNFPTKDWQTMVSEPTSGGALTPDGGPVPLSEPESQALANYTTSRRPRLILTYHSHAGIVEPNDAADSDALGVRYAASSGYRDIPTSAIGNTFDYSTSGAFEDWANQQYNIPVLVVELASATYDEFPRNVSAMWIMATLP